MPIALCEAVEQGHIKPGDNILLAAFGAGLTWGAGLVKWGSRVEPMGESSATLSEPSQTALEMLQNAIEHCHSRQRP